MRNAALVLMLAACSPTSYQDAIRVYPSSSTRFVVEARGNRKTTPGLLQSYVEKKANELCPNGFDIEGSNDATKTDYDEVNGEMVASTKHDITATINCR